MPRRNPLHDVAIVGAYNTKQARVLEQPETEVLVDAMRGALRSARLSFADVDGVNVTSSVRRWNPREVVQLLGGRPSWTGVEMGIPAVMEAAFAIASGMATTVLVATAQAAEYTERDLTAPWTRPSNEFVECWGLYTAAEFALMARRHMHLYGTKREALSEGASAIRSNGAVHDERAADIQKTIPELEEVLRGLLLESGNSLETGFEFACLHEEVRLHMDLGNYARSRQQAKKLLQQKPDFIPVLNNLSQVSWLEGDLPKAIETCRQVLEREPRNVHALSNITRYSIHAGEQGGSRQVCKPLEGVYS